MNWSLIIGMAVGVVVTLVVTGVLFLNWLYGFSKWRD
jgi:preprotein translocase subunit SecD